MHEQHTRCLLAEHRVIRLLTTLIDPSHRRKHSIDKHEGHASGMTDASDTPSSSVIQPEILCLVR